MTLDERVEKVFDVWKYQPSDDVLKKHIKAHLRDVYRECARQAKHLQAYDVYEEICILGELRE